MTIIYYDQFARGTTASPVALNGSTPAPNDIGSNIWTADSSSTTNGSQANVYPANYVIFLPWTPATGKLYKLSCGVQIPSGTTTNWMALGYSTANTGSSSFQEVGAAWYLLRDNGQMQAFQNGTGTSVTLLPSSVTAGLMNTMEVQLDTRPTLWTTEFFINGTSISSAVAYTANPSILSVGMENWYLTPPIPATNFKLEDITPSSGYPRIRLPGQPIGFSGSGPKIVIPRRRY